MPENVIINAGDGSEEGCVQFNPNARGTLYIYANGAKYDEIDLDDNKIYVPLEEMFYEGKIALGNNTISLIYKDRNGNQIFKNYYKV